MGATIYLQIHSNALRCYGIYQRRPPSPHCIIIPDRDYVLKLQLENTQSVLPIRRPTQDEIDHLERVEITLPREWNPYDPFYNDLEQSAIARNDYVPPLGGNTMLTLNAVNIGRPTSASASHLSPLNIHNHFQRHVSQSSILMADVLPAHDLLAFGDTAWSTKQMCHQLKQLALRRLMRSSLQIIFTSRPRWLQRRLLQHIFVKHLEWAYNMGLLAENYGLTMTASSSGGSGSRCMPIK